MHQPSQTPIFWTIVFLTVACGVGAGATAVYTAVNGSSQNMDQLFATLSHLFSGGIGAIFGAHAASLSARPPSAPAKDEPGT
ncbi:hypothetical protein SAMN05216236_15112 [Sedimentitalea nanhaiensis]|uniref:Uncharacterized protein n=1 Tax=Sedimentitalea nanhaiensis TaxID=999627 RepID=A0A1I7E969_9RHOB|nr:hypothetical protein SAMN05216236_15112 [Sedimentitalea nanhaiensis]